MPTVLRTNGHRFMIFTDDHEPAHVHVFRAGNVAVFVLHCPDGPPELREQKGFRLREAHRIQKMLEAHIDYLCEEWKRIHVDDGAI